MNLKIFNTRLSAENVLHDQIAINTFMNSVEVTNTTAQFIPGNPDQWSILVFYEILNGGKTKEKEKPPAITEDQLTIDQAAVFSALKLWRKDKAQEINLPEFMVCHNATLLFIAKEQPRDLVALSKIKGMGDQKIAAFGNDIIAIINAF
jgi:superfamily II DNA helicase RecQ